MTKRRQPPCQRCFGPRGRWRRPHEALRPFCKGCARIVATQQGLPMPNQFELFNTNERTDR